MIYSDSVSCRGFALCYGGMTPNESFVNENLTVGVFNQLVFVYSGSITASSDGMPNVVLEEKKFTDVSAFFGKPINYTAGSQGAFWLAINPMPVDKRFNVDLITEGSVQVQGSEKEKAIICIDKGAVCNGKALDFIEYVRVLENKTVDLVVESNSLAAIITEQ